jgi:predicted RNase H-like HicB family nuclease
VGMEVKKPESKNFDDYEILIRRRGDNDYASYCPQLNYMISGTEHEEVLKLMQEYIQEYIQQLD